VGDCTKLMKILGGLTVPGVNQIGLAKENQDAFFCLNNENFSLIICADGAGSTKFGAIGSHHLARNLYNKLKRADPLITQTEFTSKITQTINFTRNAISRYCQFYERSACISDFASTLAIAVIFEKYAFLAHLGDGCILFLDCDNRLVDSSLPENGEYSNETYFFTDLKWHEKLRIKLVDKKFSNCLVMTDGITPFALKGENIFDEFISPIIKYLKKTDPNEATQALKQTFLSDQSLQVSKDDKTLGWYLADEG
jgi:hypothetical protein